MIQKNGNCYQIGNERFTRTLEVSEHGVRTTSFFHKTTGRELLSKPCHEFMFGFDRKLVNSWSDDAISELNFLGSEQFSSSPGTEELRLQFRLKNLILNVHYIVRDSIAGMCKYLSFECASGTVFLDSMILEDLPLAPGGFSGCDFYRAGRSEPEPVAFTLEGTDDCIRIHNSALQEGCWFASAAPGVLRFFLVYPEWNNVGIGLNMSSAPFCRILKAGETFTAPATLLALYHAPLNAPEAFAPIRDMIRTLLPEPASDPGVMLCSWIPYGTHITEDRIGLLAEKAMELGFRYVVVDDGWFLPSTGEVDPAKFPHGLEAVSENVHSKGLKFGLWFNIGTSYGIPDIPEKFAARSEDGSVKKLGFDYNMSPTVQCFGSGWRNRILEKLVGFAKRYSVDYFKLDFSSIASPYGILPFGCHSHEHEFHSCFGDSFMAMYDGLKFLRDELKKRFPSLLVDFSFESFGPSAPDIASLSSCEIHHVTNHSAGVSGIQSITRLRRMFYGFSQVYPPERILHGLLYLRGTSAPEYLLTSFAGAPLVAGEMETIADTPKVRAFAEAFERVSAGHPLTEFEVVADEADLDGFKRCSKDGYGIVCLFNRSDKEYRWNGSAKNVESGCGLVVPPHDCAMFLLSPEKHGK